MKCNVKQCVLIVEKDLIKTETDPC